MPAIPSTTLAMTGGVAYLDSFTGVPGSITGGTPLNVQLPGSGASQKQAAMWGCYNDSGAPVYITPAGPSGTSKGAGGIAVVGKPAGGQGGQVLQLEVPGGITQFFLYAAATTSVNQPNVSGGIYFWVYTRN